MRAALLVAALCFTACHDAAPARPAAGPNAIAIEVKSDPPGATVMVDGMALGEAPQTVKLNPGPHRARASMSGYYPPPELRFEVDDTAPREVTVHLMASH